MTNIIFRPNLTYQRNRGRGYSTSGSYSDQLMEMVVNTNANRNMSINTNTNLSGELQLNRKMGNKGRNVTLLIKSYYDTPSRNFGLSGQLAYSEPIADRTYLQLSYTYDYSYSRNDRRAFIYDSDAYQTLVESMAANRYDIDAVLRFMDDMHYVFFL